MGRSSSLHFRISFIRPAHQKFLEYLCEILGVQVLIPVRKQDKLLAVIGIGGKAGQKSYTDHETQMAAMLAQMCAGALENSVTRQTLQSLNRQLTLKVYQLNTLFELSKDFHSVWDSETIFRILGTSLIGQLLISRCAVFTRSNSLLDLAFHRGMRLQPEALQQIQELPLESMFAGSHEPLFCSSIDSRRLQSLCTENKIHLLLPMVFNDEIRGLILLGDRKNRKPYCKEDFDFISTLGNLALVADENSRMQQQMVEKHRMERELAIAREIQVGLLPRVTPKIPGYQIDSFFLPCFTVGETTLIYSRGRFPHGSGCGDVPEEYTAALLMAVTSPLFAP
jgi:sigma-B regulation protein RsbU (phosphoserine phosphatase)